MQIILTDNIVERGRELESYKFAQRMLTQYNFCKYVFQCDWGICMERKSRFLQRYARRRTVITIRQKKGCLRTKYAHLSSQVEARPRLHAGCSRCALTVHQCCNPSHFECTSAAISKNCPIEVSFIFILPTIFTSKQIQICNCLLVTATI